MIEKMFPTNKRRLKVNAQMEKFHKVEVMYDMSMILTRDEK